MLYAPGSSLNDITLRKVIVEIDIVSNCLIESFSEGYKVRNMKARSMGTVIFGKTVYWQVQNYFLIYDKGFHPV